MRAPPASRPAPASFSTPTARPMSHSPALRDMITVRSAVAPVAHALDTLNTGMPVWPICFWSAWPMPSAGRHQVAGREHAHVGHGHVGVGQCRGAGLGREVRRCRGRDASRTSSCRSRGSRCRQSPCRSLSSLRCVVLSADCAVGDRSVRRSVRWARSRTRWPRCPRRRCPSSRSARRTFMPVRTWSGSGSTLMRLARTLVPSQSMTAATKGTGDPGRGEGHDREGPHLTGGRDVDGPELGSRAPGAGVAPIEEAGAGSSCTPGRPGAGRRPARGSRPMGSVQASSPLRTIVVTAG